MAFLAAATVVIGVAIGVALAMGLFLLLLWQRRPTAASSASASTALAQKKKKKKKNSPKRRPNTPEEEEDSSSSYFSEVSPASVPRQQCGGVDGDGDVDVDVDSGPSPLTVRNLLFSESAAATATVPGEFLAPKQQTQPQHRRDGSGGSSSAAAAASSSSAHHRRTGSGSSMLAVRNLLFGINNSNNKEEDEEADNDEDNEQSSYSTVDYDYRKAKTGSTNQSVVSSVGGTQGGNTQEDGEIDIPVFLNEDDENMFTKETTHSTTNHRIRALGGADAVAAHKQHLSLQQQQKQQKQQIKQQALDGSYDEEDESFSYTIQITMGQRLGLVLHSADDTKTFPHVHALKPDSILRHYGVQVGDELQGLGYNATTTAGMTAMQVSQWIRFCAETKTAAHMTFTFVRRRTTMTTTQQPHDPKTPSTSSLSMDQKQESGT